INSIRFPAERKRCGGSSSSCSARAGKIRMLKKSIYVIVSLLTVFVFAEHAAPQTKTIALGVISKRPLAEVEPQYRDFVRYIARKLSVPARVEGKVVTAQTVRSENHRARRHLQTAAGRSRASVPRLRPLHRAQALGSGARRRQSRDGANR